MLTPEQSRAARGWLDWSQEALAKAANVSLSTVRDFEKGRREPIANNKTAIERALQGAGIDMMADENGNPKGIERRHMNGAVAVSGN
jgi:ribosome-binding protein aMBF1 (putative translation factor)